MYKDNMEDNLPLLSEKHLGKIPDSCMKYVNSLRTRIRKLEKENSDLNLYANDADNEHVALLRETRWLREENARLHEELESQKRVLIDSMTQGGKRKVPTFKRHISRLPRPIPSDNLRNVKSPLSFTRTSEQYQMIRYIRDCLDRTSHLSKIPVRIRSSAVQTTSVNGNHGGNSTSGTPTSCYQSLQSQDLNRERKLKPTYQLPPLRLRPGEIPQPRQGPSRDSPFVRVQKQPSPAQFYSTSVPKINPAQRTSAQNMNLPKIKTVSTGDKLRVNLSKKIKTEPLPNRLKGAPKLPRI